MQKELNYTESQRNEERINNANIMKSVTQIHTMNEIVSNYMGWKWSIRHSDDIDWEMIHEIWDKVKTEKTYCKLKTTELGKLKLSKSITVFEYYDKMDNMWKGFQKFSTKANRAISHGTKLDAFKCLFDFIKFINNIKND